MTPAMRAMWLEEQLHPGTNVNHLGFAAELRGPLRHDDVTRAIDEVVSRHEMLRAVVADDGAPTMRVTDVHPVVLVVDASVWPDDRVDEFVDDLVFGRYDLEHGPLARFALLRRSADHHLVVCALHHLVADLWSITLLARDVLDHLPADATPRPLRSRFADHLRREAEYSAAHAGPDRSHWARIVSGAEPVLDLPILDQSADAADRRAGVVPVPIDDELRGEIRATSDRLGVSPAALLLAAFGTVLSRTTGRDDLMIGTVRANRSLRTAPVVGCVMNPLLLRLAIHDDDTFDDLVRRAATTLDQSMEHGRFPAIEMLTNVRVPGRRGMPNVGFLWQKSSRAFGVDLIGPTATGTAGPPVAEGDLTIEVSPRPLRGAPFDVALLAAEHGDALTAGVEFARPHVSADDAAALAGQLCHVLRSALGRPARPMCDHALVPVDALDVFGAAGPTVELDDVTVHRLIRRQLLADPARPVLTDTTTTLTAAELVGRVDELRGILADAGAGPGALVGLMTDRSTEMVAALLAILETGAAYVPMDPEFPAERLAFMADDAGVSLIVCDRTTAHLAPATTTVVLVDDAAPHSTDDVLPVGTGSDRAYVMYTSGSTGRPKGVEIEHRNVVNFLRAMASRPGFAEGDAILAITTVSFDISVLELLLPLVGGGRLVLADRATSRDAERLGRMLLDPAITIAQATPTTWRMLVEGGWPGRAGLKILCGGEPLPADLAAALLTRCDALWNMYGPTETTVWSTVHPVTDTDRPPPIGTPVDNTSVYVLDHCLRPMPAGIPGELVIGGAGVARGYLGRPELTRDRFVDDPYRPGGRMYRTGDLVRLVGDRLEHLGRTDQQIKIRGHRVELAEIEHAIVGHPDVTSAVVATWEPSPGDIRLVAYVVAPTGSSGPTTVELREHLAASLPQHMLPSRVVVLPELPRTPNDKIDRGRLPAPASAPDADAAARQPPEPGLESSIAAVWRDVLGVDVADRHDDFFALGGHSLLATRVVSRLRRLTQREVSIRTVFDHPTVAGLARAVAAQPVRPLPSTTVERTDDVEGVLTHAQERMWFLHEFDPEGSAYNIAVGLRVRGPLDLSVLEAALGDVADRHESLRTTFPFVDVAPVQRVRPTVRLAVETHDHSTLPSDEALVAARRSAEEAARLPFRLDELPLLRCAAHRVDRDDHLVVLVVHHIVCDLWALGIIASELGIFYRARTGGPPVELPPPVQQLDYARWHRELVDSTLVPEQLAYWREQLAGVGPLELPTDHPRPAVRTSHGAAVHASLPSDLLERLDAFCRTHHVSAFVVGMAAFQAVLSRVAGTNDVAVATAVANRNWLEAETVLSSLVNTVVIRNRVMTDDRIEQFIEAVRRTALGAFEHQDLPFASLVSDLVSARATDRLALADVFFNVVNAPITLPALPGTDVEVVPIDRAASQFDLSLSIDTGIARIATLEYNTDLFDADRMERLLADVVNAIEQFVTAPGRHLAELVVTSGDPGAAATIQRSLNTSADTAPDAGHASPRPGTETTISAVWSRLLAVPEPGRRDDFFEQGGHSLLAVRMITELERSTGRRLPLSALFRAPTIAELAAELDRTDSPGRWTSLVPVQPVGDRTPLFYVAPFLITSLSFANLGRALGEHQPLYVLQPQGIDTDDPVHDSIESMADHYISEIREVQPSGPYLLGGHCAGATPAFEMARRLESLGEQVALLALVDAEPPHLPRPGGGGLGSILRRLGHYARDGRLWNAIRWSARVAAERTLVRHIGRGRRRALAEMRSRHNAAHLRYEPGGTVRARTVLIRSAEWSRGPMGDWLLRWGDLVEGELHLDAVPGTHAGLVSIEQSGALAASIHRAVEAAG